MTRITSIGLFLTFFVTSSLTINIIVDSRTKGIDSDKVKVDFYF